MYIQITTRCQMSCEHCCYNCTRQGEDMSLETFRKALQVCEDMGSTPFLGGGEPTLHPQFETMLLEAITCAAKIGEGVAGVITNGGVTKRALMIAALAKGGVIYGAVSRDQFHDDISPDVVEAFESVPDGQGIKDNSNGGRAEPLASGRAIEYMGLDPEYDEINAGGDDCPCSDHVCEPSGRIRQCGCMGSPEIGDVDNGYDSPSSFDCYQSPWFVEVCLEEDSPYEHLVYA